ncbi:hypothetical protein [Virgibacillus litoralis]|uniref:DUF2127 domain-containing protein n=1 Tax=Virgibacillus litoralis TaxID=578221 RepID=A0ABS4H8Q4_9BACI|nr:hypothetical protein [Virgibacillus litoralis]MBP1947119.1 hypothetical protein [Virgibacillus litoralis]
MSIIKQELVLTPTTYRLQIGIALCSIIFTIGTTLQNFVIVNISLIETMMQMADAPNPEGQAPGFTNGFRLVGCIYIIGNALGILAFRVRSTILWWVILVVNFTQGLGFVMIPSSMWVAAISEYGIWGILPSAITDGGAIILAIIMIYTMVKYRSTWAQQRLAV